MNSLLRTTFALAASTVAGSAFAAGSVAFEPAPAATAAQRLETLAASQARLAQARTATGAKAMGSSVSPGTPQANPYRAYPPSCAADPLPDSSGGGSLVLSKSLPLYTKDANGRTAPETVKLTLWRIACSSASQKTPYNPGGQSRNSMTLLRFDRDASREGATDRIPTMPLVQISQGKIGYADAASLVRVAAEPNTVISETAFDSPIIYSTTYVLENFPFGDDWNHQYGQAFKLMVDPQDTAQNYQKAEFDVPAYASAAGAPMPFDGYAAAQWNNAAQNHGLILQVPEQYLGSDGAMTRQIIFDLLLKDLNGNPFWLVGGASFAVGATSVPADAYYLDKDLALKPWGRATFQLKHCNRLEVTYAPNTGLAAPVPSVSGVVAYDRLLSANGMLCE